MVSDKLRINGVVDESIVDGPGIRYVIFTQGCPHNCKGCHNPQTHAADGGYEIGIDTLYQEIEKDPLLTGVTFSGGEPFLQAEPLYKLACEIKKLDKTLVVYTGFVYEKLLEMDQENPWIGKLLSMTDLLIDGPYIESLRDLELQFRGSENQRLIDLAELRQGK